MQFVANSEGTTGNSEELARKLAAVRELLTEEFPGREGPLVLGLAEQLQASTPPFFLDKPGPGELAARVGDIFRFLALRRGRTATALFPLGPDRFLLVTNTPDAPYLVHTVQSCLIRQDISFQMVCHPLLAVRRERGRLESIAGIGGAGGKESLIVCRLDGFTEERYAALEPVLNQALENVLAVHRDQRKLNRQLKDLASRSTIESDRDFLEWLRSGNFIPFAFHTLELAAGPGGLTRLTVLPDASLGLATVPPGVSCGPVPPGGEFPGELQERLLRRSRVVVETLDQPSPLFRNEPLIYIGIRDGEGKTWREQLFLGLFTDQTLNQPSCEVPALRRRIENALTRLGIPPNCHDWRKTVEIFNTFPKVELFFMAPAELDQTIRSFTHLYRHGTVKVVATRSLAVRGATLLVIMPRNYYDSQNLARIEKYLARAFRVETVTSRVIHISGDYLSLHVTARPGSETFRVDLPRLERGLTRIVRPWEQRLRHQLLSRQGEAQGRQLFARYGRSFSREYRTLVHPRFALRDLLRVEKLLASGEDQVDLWGPFRTPRGNLFRLQYYSLRESYLNDLMPILENLNLCVIDEVDFSLDAAGSRVFIKSFSVRGAPAGSLGLATIRDLLLDAFGAIHCGAAQNDYLNRLLVLTGLDWQQIDIFRGYRNYYFQLGSPFTKRRVAFALINNPRVARLLYDYFDARFRDEPHWEDPLRREEEGLFPIRQKLAAALDEVADINEDRILRTLFNLIDSTVRTNFFRRQGQADYFFAFKISALGIIDMPAPRPLYEIYVHAATMEGIHLRGGRVARGGIRWSDRPDDFRTEILGLMKTQMTKNALIVPVGSKGGFVVKSSFSTREEGAQLSRAAYQVLMRGLLDLTDNRVEGEVVSPPGIVAYDEPDPYLVVAADKGTAQFSDTANAISREYRFWLDDAFASGGSHGYDHKQLGITARGAWEGVKRHFREIGTDIQREPFTVVGIGDMSGDVFGNGMLLSPQIRLLAAFDHRHIFLDPDPDPETSFAERQRLFELPRSSWADYSPALISAGGGVYPRDAKEIPLSAQVQRWLGVRHDSLDAPGLIRLLLTAEVDLLWNGGIGTYVKAGSEKNEDVGDRANDALRVDAAQLRARVVGEGGNLGFTQRGRIEYALAGGRINTDAVDNSGGVDCSDHEVNLKILMQHLLNEGHLSSIEDRNRLLTELTDDIVAAVLANNFSQCLCLSLDQARCSEDSEPFLELIDRLTRAGLLDRRGEFLPSAKDVGARSSGSLQRPELAILMAYSKMQLFQALLESGLPDRPGVRDRLAAYFPRKIRERFARQLGGHPLSREITATVITNEIIDQGGSTCLNRLVQKTGCSLPQAAEAYLVFDAVLEGRELREAIRNFEGRLAAEDRYRYLLELEGAILALAEWALERGLAATVEEGVVVDYQKQAGNYLKALGGLLPDTAWQTCKESVVELVRDGFDAEAARRLAVLPQFADFLPLVELARDRDGDLYSVARTLGEIRAALELPALLKELDGVPVRDRWDRLARQSLLSAFALGVFHLTRGVLAESDGNLERFLSRRRPRVRHYQGLVEGLRGTVPANFHPFTVLVRALEALADGSG